MVIKTLSLCEIRKSGSLIGFPGDTATGNEPKTAEVVKLWYDNVYNMHAQ